MIYFDIIITISLLLLIYMHIETKMLVSRVVKYSNDKDATKIIQLSDIHISQLYVSWKKIKNTIEKEKPDIIILTGDYIDTKSQIFEFLKFIDYIKEKNEIIMCFGNHDYKFERIEKKQFSIFKDELKSIGIKILENDSYKFNNKSKIINFIGIEDFRTRRPNVREIINQHVYDDATNVVISHNPEIILDIENDRIEYLFCGHFHGGQIWMPFNLEFKLLRNEKTCKMGFKKGSYIYNGIELYINRGLGNVLLPFRFLSRPEITIFYI